MSAGYPLFYQMRRQETDPFHYRDIWYVIIITLAVGCGSYKRFSRIGLEGTMQSPSSTIHTKVWLQYNGWPEESDFE